MAEVNSGRDDLRHAERGVEPVAVVEESVRRVAREDALRVAPGFFVGDLLGVSPFADRIVREPLEDAKLRERVRDLRKARARVGRRDRPERARAPAFFREAELSDLAPCEIGLSLSEELDRAQEARRVK